MGIVEQLRSAIVRGTVNLSKVDGQYVDEAGQGILIPIRLNWSRGLKAEHRMLTEETLRLQEQYTRLRELIDDRDAWERKSAELSSKADAIEGAWIALWSQAILLDEDEVWQIYQALPEQHWVWLTAQLTQQANEYERAALKKAGD